MDQDALASFHGGTAMQHLVGGDVVQHEADSLRGVHVAGHGHQLSLRQADILRVRTTNRHRSDDLAHVDPGHAFADSIDDTHQVPA